MHQGSEPTSAPDPDRLDRAIAAWADWYVRMGVVDALEGAGVDRRRAEAPPAATLARSRGETAMPPRRPPAAAGGEQVQHARALAQACSTITELAAVLETFDGCPLKRTATRLCFADGNPEARLMLIGEAPGAEEDRLGKPFVGPSGQLLDRMLAAIGLDRRAVWITNTIFWRPPGNRPPTATEIAVCQPFLERQIELIRPARLLFLGGSAARGLLEVTEGVTKLRGRPYTYQPADGPPISAAITFHPAYLLRQPAQKRLVWRDLLTMRQQLAGHGV
ncbi:MAG: uracil-DNA glycosylase [Geminicoccaceae bacterium]